MEMKMRHLQEAKSIRACDSEKKVPARAATAREDHAEPAPGPVGRSNLAVAGRQRAPPGSGGHFHRNAVHQAGRSGRCFQWPRVWVELLQSFKLLGLSHGASSKK